MHDLVTSFLVVSLASLGSVASSQGFYLGADLSYVNEMEDCGVVYKEDGQENDVYEIFSDHACNLVRLRLWHTPSWYDNLNAGHRYSDLADVKRAIARAHESNMHVLLDFHLSDNWADPGKQVVPEAWAGVVDDLPVLKDSLYNYIRAVLTELDQEELLPEMVQIGNETNRGILLSQAVNDAGWSLDWDRNSQLFNRAIQAVRDVEVETGKEIIVALHAAGPEDAEWIYEAFIENGVTDFDVMGISYYWAWHKPTTIPQTGDIIEGLLEDHPGYDVMIFETGYIWTTASNDNANNIINDVQSGYAPASPGAQREWLTDLTQEVINSGGKGVIYWEPAWVSSGCWTQWGRGSHQEHATFFDFDNNLIADGGIMFYAHDYENLTAVIEIERGIDVRISADSNNLLTVQFSATPADHRFQLSAFSANGQEILSRSMIVQNDSELRQQFQLPAVPTGIYLISLRASSGVLYSTKIRL